MAGGLGPKKDQIAIKSKLGQYNPFIKKGKIKEKLSALLNKESSEEQMNCSVSDVEGSASCSVIDCNEESDDSKVSDGLSQKPSQIKDDRDNSDAGVESICITNESIKLDRVKVPKLDFQNTPLKEILPKPEALVQSGRIVVRKINLSGRTKSRLESMRENVKCVRPETPSSVCDSKGNSQKTVTLRFAV